MLDEDSSSVAYTFDEDAALVDEALFHVYDRNGDEQDGTGISERDTAAGDRVVIVEFEPGALDAVTGASVEEGAVRESGTGTLGRLNQEDEVGASSPTVETGTTTGPDLTDVNRVIESETTTDPFTGEETSTITAVALRFFFDDEAATVSDGFFVVQEDGTTTALTNCEQGEGTAEGEENVVVCSTTPEDDPSTLDVDEEAEFEAARDAVLGTVAAAAVTDEEGTDNPEGAEVIAGDQAPEEEPAA